MAERVFFSPSWINKVIPFEDSSTFPAQQWRITSKTSEKYILEGKTIWESLRRSPMMAIAVFECVNHLDPSGSAFMKVYKQIPYAGSEYFPPSERAEQASSQAPIDEDIALRTLTKLGCKSAPPVINWKRETQYQDDLVPGGFVVYLVTGELPGILLTRDAYWDFTSEKRHEIREAFKKAYEDCVGHGIVPVEGVLGTNLLWDEIDKKMDSCEATEKDAWGSNIWLAWGFAKHRQEVPGMPYPLPPDILPDGSINEKLWEI